MAETTQEGAVESTVLELSPATYHQYVSLLIERMIGESLPELAGIIRLRGRLTDPGQPRGNRYFAVKIVDDGGHQAKADIPASLIQGRGVFPGQRVVVVGRVSVRSSQYGLEVKIDATDLYPAVREEAQQSALSDQGRMTIERLRTMPIARNAFPTLMPIAVTLIQSSSAQAQVSRDCRVELDKVGDGLVITPVPINILDPVAIAQAIRTAEADIVLVIRGGGDSNDFAVFEDPRVMQALAECPAHRVIGLGHSGNSTLSDLYCDHVANTPAQAGAYIRERIENRKRRMEELRRRDDEVRSRIATLSCELDATKRQAIVAEHRIPVWVLLVAVAVTFVGTLLVV